MHHLAVNDDGLEVSQLVRQLSLLVLTPEEVHTLLHSVALPAVRNHKHLALTLATKLSASFFFGA